MSLGTITLVPMRLVLHGTKEEYIPQFTFFQSGMVMGCLKFYGIITSFARPAQWKHAAFSYTNNAHWKQPHGHSKWDNFVFLLLLQHDMSMKFQDPSVVFFIGHMVAYVSHCSAAVSGRRGPGGFTNRQRCTKLSGVNIQS